MGNLCGGGNALENKATVITRDDSYIDSKQFKNYIRGVSDINTVYTIDKELGRGAFAWVKLATKKSTGK